MKGAQSHFHAEREAEQELHMTAAHLACHYELDGPNYTCHDGVRRVEPGHRRGGRN